MWDHYGNDRQTNQKSVWQPPGWSCGRLVRGWDKGFTVGGGHSCWYGTRISCGRHVGGLKAVVGVALGMRQSCWEGRGASGLQLLATSLSSSMSSPLTVRILKGLLCHVRHWCTIGNQQIVHSIVMVFDVVATLGGVAIAILGGGSVSTLGDVGRGGGKLSWPDIIVKSWQIANSGKMLELGTGRSWDRLSKLFKKIGCLEKGSVLFRCDRDLAMGRVKPPLVHKAKKHQVDRM
jgi:hypothetical protein